MPGLNFRFRIPGYEMKDARNFIWEADPLYPKLRTIKVPY